MKRPLLAVAVLFVVSLAGWTSASAQVPYNEGPVSRIVLIHILPGHFNAFMDDVKKNIIPIYESEKSAGLIVGYSTFLNVTSSSSDDWDFGVAITYKNMAALDGLADKVYDIRMKQYGDRTAEQKVIDNRVQNAHVVASFLTRDITLR